MDDMKLRVLDLVRQIDSLNREIEEHWSRVQRFVQVNDMDSAISLLNAYFRLKERLQAAEAAVAGILRGHFADK
jgi:hypothetical protein